VGLRYYALCVSERLGLGGTHSPFLALHLNPRASFAQVGCGAGLERIYEFLSTDEGPHQVGWALVVCMAGTVATDVLK
jgi:hypothetical protein